MTGRVRESFVEYRAFWLGLEGGLEFQQVAMQAEGITESKGAEAMKMQVDLGNLVVVTQVGKENGKGKSQPS